MGVSIDLRKAHLHRLHGDIVAVYSWLNDERALFLIPAVRKKAPWYIVMESAAYTWDDTDPRNVPTIARKLRTACEVLGIEDSPRNCQRLAAIIIEGLEDLVQMPSSPETEYHSSAVGQMLLRENGKAIAGQDIRLAKQGAEYVNA